jgi:MOSC domain-containing protein YiiM
MAGTTMADGFSPWCHPRWPTNRCPHCANELRRYNTLMTAPSLASIQIGQPTTHGRENATDPHDRLWTSAFFKSGLSGPVFVSRTNIAGDAQADRQNHGGVDKAVLAYAASHYDLWRQELTNVPWCHGGFGENLTLAGLTEESVCIGDVWSLGDALFQVSQPRQPCWKLARRWRITELTAMVIANGRTGWYLRVLQEGMIDAGQELTLIERPHAEWSVARANEVMHHRKADFALASKLAELPELSDAWKASLRK